MQIEPLILSTQKCFYYLPLKVLNASHNAIKHISNAIFTDFANLKVLDLSNNQITHLSDKLFDTTQLLKSIKLNDNLLQQIDTSVFTELKLQYLDISCNNLTSDNFLSPETISIAYLNLTFNAYTDINSSRFENIEVDLYGELLMRWKLDNYMIGVFRQLYCHQSSLKLAY